MADEIEVQDQAHNIARRHADALLASGISGRAACMVVAFRMGIDEAVQELMQPFMDMPDGIAAAKLALTQAADMIRAAADLLDDGSKKNANGN